MSITGRNIAVVALALAVGYIALAVAGTVDLAFGLSPTRAATPLGVVFMRLGVMWPYFFAAAVFGGVAASRIDGPGRRAWAFVSGILAAGLTATAYHELGPGWGELAQSAAELLLAGTSAAGAFLLVSRRRRNGAPPAGTDVRGYGVPA